MKDEHLVPLSSQAVTLLEQMQVYGHAATRPAVFAGRSPSGKRRRMSADADEPEYLDVKER